MQATLAVIWLIMGTATVVGGILLFADFMIYSHILFTQEGELKTNVIEALILRSGAFVIASVLTVLIGRALMEAKSR
jgi:hypothetical protein